MNISVIIPTRNAGQYLAPLLDSLLSQTVKLEIIVIDSDSRDDTVSIAEAYAEKIQLIQIPKEQFDHGGTRDYALRKSTGDYVAFFTQDALPTDSQCVEKLLAAFSKPDIAAVCGRHIAWPDAPEYERLTREFNYPPQVRIWRERDISKYGVKSYFFSNSCAIYRRDAYEAVGGFDTPIMTNEDMMMAAKLLHGGYALAYTPEATVFHSHRFTLREEYRRNYRIGYVMTQYRERLTGADTGVEGLRMVCFVIKSLIQSGQYGAALVFLIHSAVRFLGNRIGNFKGKRGLTHETVGSFIQLQR